MAAKGRLQSRQQRKTLLAQGGHLATNAAKSLGTSKTAKTARDLLLHLDHPKISLCKVVVKIHAKVFRGAQRTAFWCLRKRSSKLRAGLCLHLPWLLAEQWPVESLDRLDAASGRIALPSPPLPPDATSTFLGSVLVGSPPSYPEADS